MMDEGRRLSGAISETRRLCVLRKQTYHRVRKQSETLSLWLFRQTGPRHGPLSFNVSIPPNWGDPEIPGIVHKESTPFDFRSSESYHLESARNSERALFSEGCRRYVSDAAPALSSSIEPRRLVRRESRQHYPSHYLAVFLRPPHGLRVQKLVKQQTPLWQSSAHGLSFRLLTCVWQSKPSLHCLGMRPHF
jgi:hypothetical protein